MKSVYPIFNVLLWAWHFRIPSSPCKSQDRSHIDYSDLYFSMQGVFRLLLENSLTVFILQNGMHATNLICSSMTTNYVAL